MLNFVSNLFKKKQPSLFTHEDPKLFEKLVRQYLDSQNYTYTLTKLESVKIDQVDGTFGLDNLKTNCYNEPKETWKGIIEKHFTTLVKLMGEENPINKIESFEDFKDSLTLRIYQQKILSDEKFKDNIVFFETGLIETVYVLSFDQPDSTTSISKSIFEKWNKTREEVFAVALENSLKLARKDFESFKINEDDTCYGITDLSLYGPLNFTRIKEVPELQGNFGTFFTIPDTRNIIAYPVNDKKAITALNTLFRLAKNMFEGGYKPLTKTVFWLFNDKILPLTVEETEKGIHFTPPEEFVKVLNEIAAV